MEKEKIKNWLKNPYNLILILVLAFAVILRLYYFFLTKTQPFWWDEAAYGSLAKNYITHMWSQTPIIQGETLIRPPLFPILWSILMRIGIGEVGTRFLLEFVPSILAVFFVYLSVKEIYGKRVALISTFIFSSLWIHLFYSSRLLTNVPALPLLFLSIFLFIKATKSKKEFRPVYFSLSLILLSLSTLMRYPNGLLFLAFLLTLILSRDFYLLRKKNFWISGIIGIAPMLLFFLFNLVTKGSIFPALSGGAAETIKSPIAFYVLNFIPAYLSNYFLIFLILGIVVALFELFIGYDLISKKARLRGSLVLLLAAIIILAYFIFYIRGAEDRWLFPISLSLVAFTGLGVDYVYKFIKKYSKYLAVILIIAVLIFGAYTQFKIADPLIKNKKESFLQMKQGFEWIRDNTPQDSLVIGQGIQVYVVYYGERMYQKLPENESEVNSIDADYLVVHAFAGQPAWINNYLQNNQDKWQPMAVFFFDPQQTQPAFVIYQAVR